MFEFLICESYYKVLLLLMISEFLQVRGGEDLAWKEQPHQIKSRSLDET